MLSFLKKLFGKENPLTALQKEEEKIVQRIELEVLEKLDAKQDVKEKLLDHIEELKQTPVEKRKMKASIQKKARVHQPLDTLLDKWEENVDKQATLQ